MIDPSYYTCKVWLYEIYDWSKDFQNFIWNIWFKYAYYIHQIRKTQLFMRKQSKWKLCIRHGFIDKCVYLSTEASHLAIGQCAKNLTILNFQSNRLF